MNLILRVAPRLFGQIKGALELVLDIQGKGDFRQVTRKNGLGRSMSGVCLPGGDGLGVDRLPDDGRADSFLPNRTVVDGHHSPFVYQAAVFLDVQETGKDLLRSGDLQGAPDENLDNMVVQGVAGIHFGNRLLENQQLPDFLRIGLKEPHVVDDHAQGVGIGHEKIDLLGEKFGFLFEPGGDDPDHLLPDLQGGAEIGAAIVDLGQHPVRLGEPGVGGGDFDGDRLTGFDDLGGDAVVLMDVEGNRENLQRLLGTVVLDDLGLEILHRVIKQSDDPPVEADTVDYLVENLDQDLVYIGGSGQKRAQTEYALEQFVLVQREN